MQLSKIFFLASATALLLAACKHKPFVQPEPEVVVEDNFPPHIKSIIVNRCATPGCHNAASYQVSGGGLLLDSWEHLFDGGSHGAVIIPYSPENSSMLYFTNAHEDLGPVPTDESMKMPLNAEPLSREEYLALRAWVKQGAPDKNGNIPFAANPDTRQKIYLAHQGCDYITVIDAEKHVIMRTIPVGKVVTIESGHSLKVAPDGNNAFVSFWATQYIQQIDTRNDTVKGVIDVTNPNSNMLFFSNNGQELLVTNWYYNALLRFDINTGQKLNTFGGTFTAPHGIASNSTGDTFFVTEQYGNMLYKIPANGGTISTVSVNGNPPQASGSNMPGLHNIMMTPDYGKYFVTCEETNEVRVMNAGTHQLIQTIPVGKRPQEMAISRTKPYIFVACLEDSNSNAIYKGSVYIINYNTNEVVKKITDRYYMPHALSVDDRYGMLYVFSRNIDLNGPAPHHNSSTCDGRSGYYSIYDINTLTPLNNRRYEVTVDPYSSDVRFKQ
jgi:DNA-binding beta-propeller fold protein YncE